MTKKSRARQGPACFWRTLAQPRSARAARELRLLVPDVLLEVSVEVVPDIDELFEVEPVAVELFGVELDDMPPVPLDVLDDVPVPDVLVEELLDGSVLVVELVDPAGPRFVLLAVAGVPVPDVVGVPGACVAVFGPLPLVADVPLVPADVPVDDDCACTPMAASKAAAAAAMVKLFGSLLMRISCCRVKVRLLWVARYSALR
jgi:hypothetical protein